MIVNLGDRSVGDGMPCLLVAELGINHGGSVETALEMVRAAAKAGADACKVQAFTAESFCTDAAVWKGERQIDMFKRYELGTSDLSEVARECRKLGLLFFGTPDSPQQAGALIALGAPCLKIGSDDLIHLPLLRALALLGVPLILSTGMADFFEIRDAMDATSGTSRILLHCVSSYPTPPQEANILRMMKLRGLSGLTGYSDHTDGVEAAVGAVWLGACVVEKHFTLDRKADGPDHAFSADPPQFMEMVRRIRMAEVMRGDGGLSPAPSEQAMRVTARRSIVAESAAREGDENYGGRARLSAARRRASSPDGGRDDREAPQALHSRERADSGG